MSSGLPLSFHAEMHHNVLSSRSRGSMAAKYSKKSADMSRSSEHYTIIITIIIIIIIIIIAAK